MYERELRTLELIATDINEKINEANKMQKIEVIVGLLAAQMIVNSWAEFYRCPEYTTTEYGRGRARARPTVR